MFELRMTDDGRLEQSSLRLNTHYHQIYNVYCYFTFLFLVPWTIMLLLNAFVTSAVHKAYSVRRKMTKRVTMHEEKLVFWHLFVFEKCEKNFDGGFSGFSNMF